MFISLVLLFTIVPVIEIFLLFKVGDIIGGLNTILIVLLTGVIGASLARSQGRRILTEINQRVSRGEIPTEQWIHGLLVFGGGLLLMTPGFFTDFMGTAMILPGSRRLFVKWLKLYFAKKIKKGNVQVYTFSHSTNDFETPHQTPPPTLRDVTPKKP